MANTLRFKRGLASGIPTALAGEPLFTTDTFDLYIGNGTTNTRFQKYIASGTTSQLLRGDGSLLTMPIVLTSPANGEVLKYNGTTWVNSSDAGITGSGSAGQVAYFTGATTQAGSNNLFWDATNNRLGIGTNTPSGNLDVRGNSNPQVRVSDGTITAKMQSVTSLAAYIGTESNHQLRLITNNSPQITIFGGGNVHVGGTSDAGQRLQVTGTSYFSDSVGIGSTTLTGYNLRISNNITGITSPIAVFVDGTIQATASGANQIFRSSPSVVASATISEIRHFSALQGTFGAGSTVSTQTGFFVHSGMTGATTNYGFYGDLAAATGRWNLYMNGTAANFLSGDTQIGTGALTSEKLQVNGTMKVTGQTTFGSTVVILANAPFYTGGNIYTSSSNLGIGTTTANVLGFFTNNTERMRLDASGNLGLGVNPSAWSVVRGLQVGLTASVSGYAASTEGAFFASNSFYDGGNFKYQVNGFATQYLQINGEHRWSTAPSGTAAANITFSRGMTLFSSGNLGVGSTTDNGYKLILNGGISLSHTSGIAILYPAGQAIRSNGGIFVDYANGGTGDLVFRRGSGVTNTLTLSASDGTATFTSNLVVDTNTLFVDATNNRVGVGTATPDVTFRVAGSINSTQAAFGNVDGRGLAISTAVVGGTNEAAVVLNARSSVTSGTFIFQTDGTQRMQLDSAGLEFPNNKGLLFENASASPVGSIKMGTGVTNPLEITNGTHTVTLATLGTFISSNLLVGASTIGTSATNTIAVVNGTAPSSSATDIFHLYSADVTAGNAAPHFRTENGAVIKLYQETTSVGNSIISLGGGNAVLDDTTFDGYTLRQIVKALRNQGILA